MESSSVDISERSFGEHFPGRNLIIFIRKYLLSECLNKKKILKHDTTCIYLLNYSLLTYHYHFWVIELSPWRTATLHFRIYFILFSRSFQNQTELKVLYLFYWLSNIPMFFQHIVSSQNAHQASGVCQWKTTRTVYHNHRYCT